MYDVVKYLIDNNITISAMESCTGGYFASAVTNVENSSKIFKGSFVAYSNEAKIRFGVDKNVIEKFGVYSKETAAEMANACKNFFNADIGIGITGTFGNTDPENKDSKTGEVYFSIASKETKSFLINVPKQKTREDYKKFVVKNVFDKIIN